MALHNRLDLQTNAMYERILQLLEGSAPEQRATPPDRLEWDGVKAVLALYDAALPDERKALLGAFERILRHGTELPPSVVASTLVLASSLHLWELEPAVVELNARPAAIDSSVFEAATNFLTYRRAA